MDEHQERKIPLRLRQAEALLNRLPKSHPKVPELEKEIARRKKGYRGEKHVDYHLTFLPKEKFYTILKDKRLTIGQTSFQIDTLLISPQFLLIIDAKNYSGSLYIDRYSEQLRCTIGEVEQGYPNPISQLERQCQLLKEWLQKHFEAMPVEYMAAFHEGSGIFKTELMDKRVFDRVVFADNLIRKIQSYERLHNNKPSLDEKKIRKLKKLIVRHHQPVLTRILEQYGISTEELVKGVQCPNCARFGMEWISGSWRCSSCMITSKNAHTKAIEEFLLLNKSMTNSQCKEFLNILSSHASYRFIKPLKLPYNGNNKGRKYYFNLNKNSSLFIE
ncbi:nuclease-related domain-containing protein [Bacillus tuaregi]|uniref:nuclease-related domain-containing protein n=1 Tax=Bacillus tuaregi TaxID=1816695 RepID=UPI001356626E|nr:nuclease-related domain-containing protein [Bacillus tuaregi]